LFVFLVVFLQPGSGL